MTQRGLQSPVISNSDYDVGPFTAVALDVALETAYVALWYDQDHRYALFGESPCLSGGIYTFL